MLESTWFRAALLITEVGLAAAAIGFALVRRRGPVGTIAWILAILMFPILGALAWFAFANPSVRRPIRKRKQIIGRFRGDRGVRVDDPVSAGAQQSLLRAVTRATGFPSSPGNRVVPFTDNRAAFARIHEGIASAERWIWAEYYALHGDGTGNTFLSHLPERAAAGVEVRLLIDAVGSAEANEDALSAFGRAGGHLQWFLPVNPFRRQWAVHLRNHRKVIAIDGKLGFVGGMNIGDDYAGAGPPGSFPWRDMHLCVTGPAAGDLARVFAEDWCFMTDEELPLPDPPAAEGTAQVAILPSGPDQAENATGIAWFAAIGLALRRVWLTTPYFAPDEPLLAALTTAARRGLDVRVIVPRKSDMRLMTLVNRSYYPLLLESGVRVYEYMPAVIHAKTLVVDDEIALVGSANLDRRSFRLNFEVGALVVCPDFADAVAAAFTEARGESQEVRRDEVAARGTLPRLVEGVAQLLTPLV